MAPMLKCESCGHDPCENSPDCLDRFFRVTEKETHIRLVLCLDCVKKETGVESIWTGLNLDPKIFHPMKDY